MNEHQEYHASPNLSFLTIASYEQEALRYVKLDGKSDPEGILRKGLIEETEELSSAKESDIDEMQKEIGDILWYLTSIAAHQGTSMKELLGSEDRGFDETFSTYERTIHRLPILDQGLRLYDRSTEPRAALGVDILRLVDSLNPKTPEVWIGIDPEYRNNVSFSLVASFLSLGDFAKSQGLSIDESAKKTLEKLATRKRKPHVIEDKDASRINSMRDRLPLGELAIRLGVKIAKNNPEIYWSHSQDKP